MDRGTDRDVAKLHGIAGLDICTVAALDLVADVETLGSQDVSLFAVRVMQQGDPASAVWVVLDTGDLGRNTVLDALEVDNAVALLVTTTAVT